MLIGIIGRRRAGKDTAAQALTACGFENVKFAGALKEMLRAYLRYVGTDPTQIEDAIEGELKEVPTAWLAGKSCRWAMQTLGTEWGRDLIGKNLWVDAAIARAKQFTNVVISDVRFGNEVQAIKGAGGTIIKITRPGTCEDQHVSETEMDSLPFDYVIDNDETIDTLQQEVLQIVQTLKP